ncbi:phosphatase PAP2 family protein [Patescibacteria group bacterium]|nr:phosphatase PAP2 family protein [Patescibacteria group bacterium]
MPRFVFPKYLSPLKKHLFQSPVGLLIGLEMIIGVFSSFTLAYFFLKIADEVVDKNTQFLDITLSTLIYHLRTPTLTHIMILISNFGAAYTLVGLMFILIALLLRRHRKEALLFSLVSALGLGINLLLKNVFARPRPLISPLIPASSYSFPSGHAMNSLVFYFMISAYMYHFTHNKLLSIFAVLISILMVILIGFSRIYLGVHYPSDILGGYFIGLWWLVTAFFIDKTIIFFELFKEPKTR